MVSAIATVSIATTNAVSLGVPELDTASCDSNATTDNAHRIDVMMMDKIRKKPYLQSSADRIPSTLRILAIDLQKEMRSQAFKNGKCRLEHVFEDTVASPKVIQILDSSKDDNSNDNKHHQHRVQQKLLVQSLIQCFSSHEDGNNNSDDGDHHSPKVEILEASIAELNPYGLRFRRQVGDIQYDPLSKYGDETTSKQEETGNSVLQEVSTDKSENVVVDEVEKQLSAPWHQYAWIEELHLRVSILLTHTVYGL
jgi:hypothetical protein